jgi:dUTPase
MSEIPVYKFAIREDLKDCDIDFLPKRAEPKATGWDVKAAFVDKKELIIKPFQYFKIPLGFRAFCPEGWWLELRPRSSTHGKKHLSCLYGVVDETYEGQLFLSLQYIPNVIDWEFYDVLDPVNNIKIEFGEAIAQIVPFKRKMMFTEEISNEQYDRLCVERNACRGSGGFGSTG